MSIKMCLMATLDNYMFQPLLARLSSRELKGLTIYIVHARGAEISTYGPYCIMEFPYVVICSDYRHDRVCG